MTASARALDRRGFTLLEVMLVMLILTILVSGLAVPLSTQVAMRRHQETRRILDEVIAPELQGKNLNDAFGGDGLVERVAQHQRRTQDGADRVGDPLPGDRDRRGERRGARSRRVHVGLPDARAAPGPLPRDRPAGAGGHPARAGQPSRLT